MTTLSKFFSTLFAATLLSASAFAANDLGNMEKYAACQVATEKSFFDLCPPSRYSYELGSENTGTMDVLETFQKGKFKRSAKQISETIVKIEYVGTGQHMKTLYDREMTDITRTITVVRSAQFNLLTGDCVLSNSELVSQTLPDSGVWAQRTVSFTK